MTVALAKDVEEFLQEQVRAGVAGDPSKLANNVLRCVHDQQRRSFERRREGPGGLNRPSVERGGWSVEREE